MGPASQFDRLSVTLTVDGPPMALDAFLLTVEQHEPMLAVTSIDIQRKRQSRREKRDTFEFLSVRLRVVALSVSVVMSVKLVTIWLYDHYLRMAWAAGAGLLLVLANAFWRPSVTPQMPAELGSFLTL